MRRIGAAVVGVICTLGTVTSAFASDEPPEHPRAAESLEEAIEVCGMDADFVLDDGHSIVADIRDYWRPGAQLVCVTKALGFPDWFRELLTAETIDVHRFEFGDYGATVVWTGSAGVKLAVYDSEAAGYS